MLPDFGWGRAWPHPAIHRAQKLFLAGSGTIQDALDQTWSVSCKANTQPPVLILRPHAAKLLELQMFPLAGFSHQDEMRFGVPDTFITPGPSLVLIK